MAYQNQTGRRKNAASVLRRRTNPIKRTGASGFGAMVAEVTDKSGRLIGKVKWTGAANKTQRYAWEVVDTVAGRYSGYSSTESGAIKKIKGTWNAYLKKYGRPEDSPFYRRKNPVRTPRSPSAFANPRKGYVVHVGSTIAWVGKTAAEAKKVITKLLDAGYKAVKGYEAKLLGTKLGWRKQYRRASNPHFKGRLGTGTRFDNCVRKMSKRKGVYDPAGLCASIGRRKYGAKRMTKMAARGRRRSNPMYEVFYSTGGHSGPFRTLQEAIKFAKDAYIGNEREKWVKVKPYGGGVGGFGPTVATIVGKR